MLSSLGSQEIQVYTGGTPATADAQGIAGYINQVVKTGTFPGFGTVNAAVGGPAFYHKLSVEAGGSTPDRLFTYYVGLAGANQDYRYVNNRNGGSAADLPWFFYPVNALPGLNGFVYDGTAAPPSTAFTTGSAFGIANTSQRDTVVNVHIGLPHHHDALRDDVQLLYLTSEVVAQYYSDANDLGQNIVSQLYNDNGVAIVKAQYQHVFTPSAFLRVYGYTLYSNWFIWGPNSASQPLFGAELADYEIGDHTYGFNVTFTDQLSDKHLLTASASYTGSNLQRYSAGFFRSNPPITNYVGNDGNCYDPTPASATFGQQVACYGAVPGTTSNGTPFTAPPPPGSPASLHNAQWLVTDTGFKANLNQVDSRFSAASLTDQWRPNDRMTVNAGVRLENFRYLLGPTAPNDPARAFWFSHYNQEFCYGPGLNAPVDAGSGACPSGTTRLTNDPLVDKSGGTISATRFEPRLGFTYTLNPNAVLRGSFGVYARPQNTSWVQYNTTQEDLASFLGSHFYSYGFRSPEHDIRPDTSYNADVSLEKRLNGVDWSFKLTPFYRSTKDQLQNFFIDPLTGLESGLNVGHKVSYGIEFALRKGDFSRPGLSRQLSYTYTHSRIQYHNFDNSSRNVIDGINTFIQQYNAFTASGGGAKCYTPASASGPGTPDNACAPGDIPNPYYSASAAPLLDRNAFYTTYDVIPGPFSAATGYEVPNVATLILNYRHARLAITPSFSYSSGASYGSPLVWPGYLPNSCSATLPNGQADPVSCNDNGGLPVFTPDPYT